MNKVVQVFCRGGQFNLILSGKEASTLFNRWREFDLTTRPATVIRAEGTTLDGAMYSFLLSEVTGMFVLDVPEEVQRQLDAKRRSTDKDWRGGSGYNNFGGN